MKRVSAWDMRLAEYLAYWRQGFEQGTLSELAFWGSRDCCTFAAGGVYAVTGEDPMAEFRGEYATREESAKALRETGEGTLLKTLDAKFPGREIAFGRRGDLAFYSGNVGVIAGAEAIFVGQEDDGEGLTGVPRADWSHVWSVG